MIQIFLIEYKDFLETGGWLSLLFLVESILWYDFLPNRENYNAMVISILMAVLRFFDIDPAAS